MSDQLKSTVMGPDRAFTPGKDMLLPPRLSTSTDKFKWRKRVMLWVTTVKRFAKGGDKRAKGILSALGLTLFNALDQVFSSQVEQSIAAGIINLDGDDDETVNLNKQFHIVHDIINLVAKDSPTDGIRRLVQMMRLVFNCTRKNGESPSMFARRYQALALDYLNHCDTATIQQDGQNFAMMLLENAKLPATVYSSIITRLVSTITSRADTAGNKIFVVSKDRLESIVRRTEIMQDLVQHHDATADFSIKHIEQSKSIVDAITATITANELHVTQDRTIFRITLDDAVEVLKDLKVEENEDTADARHIGAMLGKRDFDDNTQQARGRFGRDKRQRTYIPHGQGPKAVSRCRGRNEPNHWYRDPECIYNVVKALMEGKEIPTETIQKLAPATRELFKDQNGNVVNKIPVSKLVDAVGTNDVTQNQASCTKANMSYFQ